jgi:hypothetical protein
VLPELQRLSEKKVEELNLEMCSKNGGSNFLENMCTYVKITGFITQKSVIFIIPMTKLKTCANYGSFRMREKIVFRVFVQSNDIHVSHPV